MFTVELCYVLNDTGSNSLSNSDRLALAQPLRLVVAKTRCNHGELAAHNYTYLDSCLHV